MSQYKFRENYSAKGIDAQKLGAYLDKIQEHNDGIITPQAVVDKARNPRSPIHELFEWDDTEAAKAHRRNQARYLIRSVVVVLEKDDTGLEEDREIRAFVDVKTGEADGYVTIARAMSDTEMRTQVIKDALRELIHWKKQYDAYVELSDVIAAINKVEEMVGALEV